MTNLVKDALRPLPDAVAIPGEEAAGGLLLEGATAALELTVRSVVGAASPPIPRLFSPPPSPSPANGAEGVAVGAEEVMLLDDEETGCGDDKDTGCGDDEATGWGDDEDTGCGDDEEIGCGDDLGRPPCLQWPALATAAYAKKRRKRILKCI